MCCNTLHFLCTSPLILAARKGKAFPEELAERFVTSLQHRPKESKRAEDHSALQIKLMTTLLSVLTSILPLEQLLEQTCSAVVSNTTLFWRAWFYVPFHVCSRRARIDAMRISFNTILLNRTHDFIRFDPERVVAPLFCADLNKMALKTAPCLRLLAAAAEASMTASSGDLCARVMELLGGSQKLIPSRTTGIALSLARQPAREIRSRMQTSKHGKEVRR